MRPVPGPGCRIAQATTGRLRLRPSATARQPDAKSRDADTTASSATLPNGRQATMISFQELITVRQTRPGRSTNSRGGLTRRYQAARSGELHRLAVQILSQRLERLGDDAPGIEAGG